MEIWIELSHQTGIGITYPSRSTWFTWPPQLTENLLSVFFLVASCNWSQKEKLFKRDT